MITSNAAITIDAHPRGVRLRVGGKTIILPPLDAIQIGNRLSTCAIVNHPLPKADFEIVEDLLLRPYVPGGTAMLQFTTNRGGPFHFQISAHWLAALASAAQAALEQTQPGGTA